jgi:hypothetical protein
MRDQAEEETGDARLRWLQPSVIALLGHNALIDTPDSSSRAGECAPFQADHDDASGKLKLYSWCLSMRLYVACESRTATAYHSLEDMQRKATTKHVRLIVTERVVQRVVTVALVHSATLYTGQCWLPTTPPPIVGECVVPCKRAGL